MKNKVLSSLVWKLLERGGTQGIQLIISIVLARLLSPEDYGIIALITVFIVIANIFVQSSFNNALIQKKDADEVDFSSVFYLSFIFTILLYLIIFFSAPLIASFYDKPILIQVLRVLALSLFLSPFTSIQNAYIAKKMLFKMLFFSSLGSIIISGSIGIYLAYSGFGVWALVYQQIASQISITIILWFTVKWRPKLLFSLKKVKGLFSYGWKILVSSIINRLDWDLRSLVIGKMYNASMLGYFNRGIQVPELIATNMDSSIQPVLFPVLANEQDDKKRVKEIVRRTIVTSSFIIFPAMIGLAAISEPFVRILLTDKWLPSVPFMQIFCISYAITPIHTANLQAINALGRSDIFLKLEIIKRSISFVILIITMFIGIYAMAIGILISGIISAFVNIYPNKKLLNYSYAEQAKDIFPSLFISLIMGIAVYRINFLELEPMLILIIQIVLGVTIYVGLAKIFKFECFTYLLTSLKDFFKKRKKVA
ncbi:MAG: lipopolysaccharide biosynthesis protein [Eubacteriales bacterium]